MKAVLLSSVVALAATLAACGGDTADAVDVTASGDACTVAKTDLAAGKTTFRVQNEGNEVTEVYVYAEGDRVVTERENIGPGTSAEFTANLAAGTYEVACKPGQTGDGIRQTITVSGEGGAALPAADSAGQRITMEAQDYSYTGLDDLSIEAGSTVAFEMVNDGTVAHEFEVLGPDGVPLGEIGPTDGRRRGLRGARLRRARHLSLRVRHRRPRGQGHGGHLHRQLTASSRLPLDLRGQAAGRARSSTI